MLTWTDAMHTMREAFREIISGEHSTPWVSIGNFANDFFEYHVRRRIALISDPIELPDNPSREQLRWAVFCAGSVEHLCRKYRVKAWPVWIHDPRLSRLEEPWYFTATENPDKETLAYLRKTTPRVFARRNIYCGNRVLLNKKQEARRMRAALLARKTA